jgi:hypothetical protein
MVLEFTIDRNRDPDGSQLHRLLQAQLTCECMGAARCLFTHLLAITGIAIWPDLLPPDIRFFVLVVFGGILFLALRVIIEEIIWRIRLKCCLKANDGVKMTDPHGSD